MVEFLVGCVVENGLRVEEAARAAGSAPARLTSDSSATERKGRTVYTPTAHARTTARTPSQQMIIERRKSRPTYHQISRDLGAGAQHGWPNPEPCRAQSLGELGAGQAGAALPAAPGHQETRAFSSPRASGDRRSPAEPVRGRLGIRSCGHRRSFSHRRQHHPP